MHDERQSEVFLIRTLYFSTIEALDTFVLDDHFPGYFFGELYLYCSALARNVHQKKKKRTYYTWPLWQS